MNILKKKYFKVLIVLLILILIGLLTSYLIMHHTRPNSWMTDSGGTRYIKSDGEQAASEWLMVDDSWYYFGADGYMMTGVTTIDGLSYSFSDSGILQTGWVEIDGSSLYILPEHTIATGPQIIGKKRYYFDSNGIMLTGEFTIDDNHYLADSDGILLNGWTEGDDGNIYYVNSDGSKNTGWTEIDNQLYYFSEDGSLLTGWQEYLGDKYYFESDGTPASGITQIDNTYYTFDDMGRLITKDYLLDSIDAVKEPFQDDTTKVSYSDNTLIGLGGYTPDSQDIDGIQDIIDGMRNCSTLGFVMINTGNGQGVAYNINQKVYSASCIKGPYIASLVSSKPEMIEKNENSLRLILEYSDNNIYSNYRKTYGRECFETWCEEAHVDLDVATYHYPQLNARSLAKLWIQNYYFLNTDTDGMKIRDWLTHPNASAIYTALGIQEDDLEDASRSDNSDTAEGLGYRTESKAGWISQGKYRATTDGGIIYPDDGAPYIIAIISDMPSDLNSLEPLCIALNDIYNKTTN